MTDEKIKCKNCGMFLWESKEWEYPPKDKGKGKRSVLVSQWWHDYGKKGVYKAGKGNCQNPEPRLFR